MIFSTLSKVNSFRIFQLKLRGKILAGFSVLLFSVLLAIIFTLFRLEAISDNISRLQEKSPQFDEVIDHVSKLESEVYPAFENANGLIANLEKIQNVFLDSLNSDDIYILDDSLTYEDEFLSIADAMLEGLDDSDEEQILDIKGAFKSYVAVSKKIIPVFISGTEATNLNMNELTEKSDLLRDSIFTVRSKKEESFFASLSRINEMSRNFKEELFSASAFINGRINNLKTLIPIGTVFILGGGLLFALIFIEIKVLKPVRRMIHMCVEMEKGHLNFHVEVDQKDEIGQMAATLNRFSDFLRNQVVAAMTKLANGDLTFTVVPHDTSDSIGLALNKACLDLNSLMSQVLGSGSQIASGSRLISNSCQTLSAGVSEQNESIRHITFSMDEMGKQIKHNAENASQVNILSKGAREAAIKGSEHMDEMVEAMKEMNEAGKSVIKVIKVIDEIAFQTNLLALNAAVEAARAGKHGRGFAVVAEEVRGLAARSAEAARETAELIEGSVKKAERGSSLADITSNSFNEIVSSVTSMTDLIKEIAEASSVHSVEISNVVGKGLDQIRKVTKQNETIANDCAAASEELSCQAEELQLMLTYFTLKRKVDVLEGNNEEEYG